MNWNGATVLVTGGTGSFGRKFVETLLRKRPRKVIVFSRDEHKQHEMRGSGLDGPRVEYRVGDVRDARRLDEVMPGVTVVVHAAALKQVPVCEAQPMEAILTNVLGARNVIDAALRAGVARVLALSTDKAVHPINVYGATKLLAERLFVEANGRRDNRGTRLSCVRYGNVIGSRGSVVPELQRRRGTGRVAVTDPDATRFWMTLGNAVAFVVRCLGSMKGGEVFVPRVRGARLVDLVRAVAPNCSVDLMGRRPGDKTHELLISEDEAPYTEERPGMYVFRPWLPAGRGRRIPLTRFLSSEADPLSAADLRRLVDGGSAR